MIKINLLPLEDRKKSKSITLPSLSGVNFVWPIAVVGLLVGMIVAVSTLQGRKIHDLEQKIAEARAESEKLAPQLEKIRKLTKEREEVNKRLNIIASLDKERYLRVRMLNDISKQLPSNCWLTSVQEIAGDRVTVDGVTFSNYIIADFMNNLERSDLFGTVSLIMAQEGKIKDYNVIKFSLEYPLFSDFGGFLATGRGSNES